MIPIDPRLCFSPRKMQLGQQMEPVVRASCSSGVIRNEPSRADAGTAASPRLWTPALYPSIARAGLSSETLHDTGHSSDLQQSAGVDPQATLGGIVGGSKVANSPQTASRQVSAFCISRWSSMKARTTASMSGRR